VNEQLIGMQFGLLKENNLMIPFWIFGVLLIPTLFLYYISCTPESPVKKNFLKFKTWCRDRWNNSFL